MTLQRLGSIDRRLIFIIMFILIVIPLVQPIGLPIEIEEPTRLCYELLDELEPDSIVGVGIDFELTAMAGAHAPLSHVMISHLFTLPVKIIFFGFQTDTNAVYDMVINKIDVKGKVYGQDYVHLGYIPGFETGLAIFSKDIREVIKEDYYGTDIDEIHIMVDINTADDFDVFISFAYGYPGVHGYVRQIYTPFNKPLIIAEGGGGQDIIPYFKATQVIGYVAGLKAVAEYELLSGKPGEAIKSLDALSIAFLGLILLIFVGNIPYVVEKYKRPYGGK